MCLVFDDSQVDETLVSVEVTPFREESNYSNKRHPSEVSFGVSLEKDLERRDFTINAIAFDPITNELIDPQNGVADLHKKLIRAVGDPERRFNEDALRLLRAVRISAQLCFEIEDQTMKAIVKLSGHIKEIAIERIRDEFQKTLQTHPTCLLYTSDAADE